MAVGRMMNGPMDDRVKTMSSGGHVRWMDGWMDGCEETGQAPIQRETERPCFSNLCCLLDDLYSDCPSERIEERLPF